MSSEGEPRGRDAAIVAAAVAGRSRAATVADLGCSLRTVDRVRHTWRDRIRDERDRVAEEAAAAMLDLIPAALRAYADLVDSPQPAIRLGAARDIVTNALRMRDATEIERRIAELEAQRRPWEAA